LAFLSGEEGGDGLAAGGEGVLKVGRQGRRLDEAGVDPGQLAADGVAVGGGEGGVAAAQRLAGAEVGAVAVSAECRGWW
jgi:hypothetical protein